MDEGFFMCTDCESVISEPSADGRCSCGSGRVIRIDPPQPVTETPAQRVTRIMEGEWKVYRETGGEPVMRITSRLAPPDGRRCTNFLTLDEVAELLNSDPRSPAAAFDRED